ncbi:cytosolic protein [Virgibacillus dakarensis]|uniref:Cytosolic protein n=1 Tax=Lentibacillus populi TaxID=1827502 RepID=A0A9W5TTX9_9BACI|nr:MULTISPECIES: cytosolic protein [Bacillaceae]MBT2218590.1 cytosolic protein [Virgibacillus dakarensis]MTW84273.1 cytosolic protein [Virgibacillus dakarensis]GGB27706.1 hypothetical protein GCM10011409_01260 [Lentibacillus populi]
MSLKNIIVKYFNNHAETSENHHDTTLQTHYYKTTKDKGLQMVEEYFSKSGAYQVNSVSKEHGEISAYVKKGRKAFIIVTIIMVRPYQTAIDFSVTTESLLPFDFGYSTKLIQRLYNEFNKTFPLID